MDDADALFRQALEAAPQLLERDRVSTGSAGAAARRVRETDLTRERTPRHALSELRRAIDEAGVRTTHRRHFGWMNASVDPAAAVADLVVALLNPQLATRHLAPGPVEIEARIARELAALLDMPEGAGGVFTSGGSEANATALVAALARAIPDFAERGLHGAPRAVIYASAEAHDSLDKAARAHGLGRAVRRIPTDPRRAMDPDALTGALDEDLRAGRLPVMVVSTAGTTNLGAFDPIAAVGEIAAERGVWHHVDAAWGGMVALSPPHRAALDGIAGADSVTLDPHKGLGAPLGTGIALFRAPDALAVFDASPAYGPASSAPDPYARSAAWSRRFVGARLWLPLLVGGWPRLARRVARVLALTEPLREAIDAAGFTRVGPASPLPVACFVDPAGGEARLARRVNASGDAWVAVTRVNGRPALRAQVCSPETDRADLEALAEVLRYHRES